MSRFAFTNRKRADHDVTAMRSLLKVSQKGSCAWLGRPASTRAVADEVLTDRIRAAFMADREARGAPRINADLADAGVHVGRKRAAGPLRAARTVSRHRRERSLLISRQVPSADVAPDR